MSQRMSHQLTGLIAAVYTPLRDDGSLAPEVIPDLVEHLIAQGIAGFYVCGSTGEGPSLTTGERRRVAEAYVQAAARRVPVIIQVGHNSLAEARSLARHGMEIGAHAISAAAPSYFKAQDAGLLAECMAEVASGAPELPFYYYHIPALTGVLTNMVDFLRVGAARIRNLVGLKYTAFDLGEFLACQAVDSGRFDILWGADEMLLGGLSMGAKAAVGSTYNIAAPLYRELIAAFEAGNLTEARQRQEVAVRMIHTISEFPFHPAMKRILRWQGFAVGTTRLPLPRLSDAEVDRLRQRLLAVGLEKLTQPKSHERMTR